VQLVVSGCCSTAAAIELWRRVAADRLFTASFFFPFLVWLKFFSCAAAISRDL